MWEDLPVELQEWSFSFLEVKDLARCALVCTSCLWKRLYLRDFEITEGDKVDYEDWHEAYKEHATMPTWDASGLSSEALHILSPTQLKRDPAGGYFPKAISAKPLNFHKYNLRFTFDNRSEFALLTVPSTVTNLDVSEFIKKGSSIKGILSHRDEKGRNSEFPWLQGLLFTNLDQESCELFQTTLNTHTQAQGPTNNTIRMAASGTANLVIDQGYAKWWANDEYYGSAPLPPRPFYLFYSTPVCNTSVTITKGDIYFVFCFKKNYK